MSKEKRLKVKKPSWWEEFKTFAIKGNAMALAVGTIIGAAFSTITKSLTDDVIMPVVNIFLGGADFSKLKIRLPYAPWVTPEKVAKLDALGNPVLDANGKQIMVDAVNELTYGNLISAIINFLILALVVFFLVKGLNKLSEMGKKKEEEEAVVEEPAPEPEPTKEEVLLTEIRDLLKNK